MKLTLITFLTFLSFVVVAQEDTTSSALYQKIISLDSVIRNDPSRQTSSFNVSDTSSLPIGITREIGNAIYIICIDSAWFTPDGAFFNVYMAMQPPNSDKPIAFAAKGIQFNPKGVSVANGARLQLISQQVINIGPKVKMVFKNDGQNFVEFDCNGYKLAGISVDFIFDSQSFENATDPSQPVKASMQMTATDINDITYQLNSITPFRLKPIKDFVFSMTNVIVDFSDVNTPTGVPQNYISNTPGGIGSWTGFYAQNISVKLPQKLSTGANPIEIYASDMIIDDSGLSGEFGANNLFTTAQGSMDNAWGFSIENLAVNIAHNSLMGGTMSGEIKIPQLDDAVFDYNASMYESPGEDRLGFNFTIAPDSTITINAFKSELALDACSQFNIGTVGDQFVPSAVLSGSWTVDYEKARFEGVGFQNVHLGTTAPYLTSGVFSLITNQNTSNLFRFGVSLDQVGITQTSNGNLAFTVGVGMNMGDGTNSFSVNTLARVITDRTTGVDGYERFTFNNLAVDAIQVDLSTTAFELHGVIAVMNDDPVFGDLFYGSVSLGIDNVIEPPMLVSVGFGKMPTYKYWFTDASIPTNIPITPTMYISSVYGGVQNRVASNQTDQQLLNRVAGLNTSPNANLIPFTPDPNQGLLFRAGVGIQNQVEKVFNGEAMLTIAFNPNGGFQSIDFLGQAYMMVTRQQRLNPNAKKVYGNIAVGYNHINKVFDATVNASIYFPSTLSGGLNIALHIDTNDWYFWLNNPVNRANLELVNMFYVNTYFMIGTQIMPIPPPPSYITNLVGGGSIGTIDPAIVNSGGGFATGVQFGVNFGGEFPQNTEWRGFVNVNVAGGFDMMLINSQNVQCSGSSDPVGVNGFYAMGQVYAYLSGAFGVRKYDPGENSPKKTYNLGSLQVGALLQGKLPKPSYVYGAIGINANVLGIINFSFDADVEFGTDCMLVGI